MPKTAIASITPADLLADLREMTSTGEARRIRVSSRLSQGDVSRSIGTDASTIGRWERGERLPTGEQAFAYLRLLRRLGRVAA